MKLHTIDIGPQHITIDGTRIVAHADGPTIKDTGLGVTVVNVPVLCDNVTLNGDPYRSNESTPIYDALLEAANYAEGENND